MQSTTHLYSQYLLSKQTWRGLAIIITATLLLLLTACGNDAPTPSPIPGTPGIHDIQVLVATPTEQPLMPETFPLDNCGGTGPLKQTLSIYTSVEKEVSIGQRAMLKGGGEVEIPETLKLAIEAEIEATYQKTYNSATTRLDEIRMEVAPKTKVEYTIEWYEKIFSSAVEYKVGDATHQVPYIYKLRVPKGSRSIELPCSPLTLPEVQVSPSTVSPTPQNTQTLLGGGSGQLAFSAWKDGSQYNSEIYLLNLDMLDLGIGADTVDPANIINLSDNQSIDKEPSWSPDGTSIIFVSRRDNNYEIYVMNANGENPINITRHPDRDYQPAWSPDGAYIAFSSYRGPGANQDIFIMDSMGNDVRQISPTGRYYQDPAWSRDGNEIFFVAWEKNGQDDTEIYAYNLAEGTLREVFDPHKPLYALDVSPDGRWLVFVSTYSGFFNLYRVGTDGYNLQQLTQQTQANYTDPAWSPDGKWIAFVAEGDTENTLYLYNVKTKKSYALLSLPGLRSPAWRP